MNYQKPKVKKVSVNLEVNSMADNKRSCNDRGCCVLSLKFI